jgi:hypothetical protein
MDKVIILLKRLQYPTTDSALLAWSNTYMGTLIKVLKIFFITVLTTSQHLLPVLSHPRKGIQNHQVTFNTLLSHSLGMQHMPYYVIF